MKISKLILACVLSGIVGNVFAESIAISCKFDNPKIKMQPEIEFDDKDSSTVSIDGESIYYDYYTEMINTKAILKEFNSLKISWCQYATDGAKSSFCYSVNRKTGTIIYEFKSSIVNMQETFRGKCNKIENDGF